MADQFVTLTERTAEQTRPQSPEGGEGIALRLAVRKLKDGSVHYAMEFDVANHERDHTFMGRKPHWLSERTLWRRCGGMTVEYADQKLGKHRFIFLIPNAPNYVPPEG